MNKDMRFTVAIVLTPTATAVGYCPNGTYINAGDTVTLEEYGKGIIAMLDTYNTYEEVQKYQQITGLDLLKILNRIEVKAVDWSDQKEGAIDDIRGAKEDNTAAEDCTDIS